MVNFQCTMTGRGRKREKKEREKPCLSVCLTCHRQRDTGMEPLKHMHTLSLEGSQEEAQGEGEKKGVEMTLRKAVSVEVAESGS